MVRKNICRMITLVGLLCFSSFSVADEGFLINPEAVPVYAPRFSPYADGEKAVYKATWNGIISVATAEIYTTPLVANGKKVYQVRVEAQTSKLLDLIWRMRDTISSTFDAKALSPSRFAFNQRENSRVIDTEAYYNSVTNRWVVNRQQVGKKTKKYEFDSHNTVDPITAVYLARSLDFKVGDRLYFNIFGGRYRYLLELYVERKEPVEMASGRVIDAFRIVPRIRNTTKKGYAKRLYEAFIWISADERRLPIKMSSKIAFGSVYLELVQDKIGIQSTGADSPSPAS